MKPGVPLREEPPPTLCTQPRPSTVKMPASRQWVQYNANASNDVSVWSTPHGSLEKLVWT